MFSNISIQHGALASMNVYAFLFDSPLWVHNQFVCCNSESKLSYLRPIKHCSTRMPHQISWGRELHSPVTCYRLLARLVFRQNADAIIKKSRSIKSRRFYEWANSCCVYKGKSTATLQRGQINLSRSPSSIMPHLFLALSFSLVFLNRAIQWNSTET